MSVNSEAYLPSALFTGTRRNGSFFSPKERALASFELNINLLSLRIFRR